MINIWDYKDGDHLRVTMKDGSVLEGVASCFWGFDEIGGENEADNEMDLEGSDKIPNGVRQGDIKKVEKLK